MKFVVKLVGYDGVEGFCGFDHLGDLPYGGDAADEVLGGIGLFELLHEVLGYAVAELLDGIDAGGFEQLGELRAYAFDAEEVGVVGPLEDEFLADTSLGCQCGTAFGCGAFLQEVFYLYDACLDEFGSIGLAYTLDVDDFVSHSSWGLMVNNWLFTFAKLRISEQSSKLFHFYFFGGRLKGKLHAGFIFPAGWAGGRAVPG